MNSSRSDDISSTIYIGEQSTTSECVFEEDESNIISIVPHTQTLHRWADKTLEEPTCATRSISDVNSDFLVSGTLRKRVCLISWIQTRNERYDILSIVNKIVRNKVNNKQVPIQYSTLESVIGNRQSNMFWNLYMHECKSLTAIHFQF